MDYDKYDFEDYVYMTKYDYEDYGCINMCINCLPFASKSHVICSDASLEQTCMDR